MNTEYFSVHATKRSYVSENTEKCRGRQKSGKMIEKIKREAEMCGNHCPFPDDCHPDVCPLIRKGAGRWKREERFLALHEQGKTDKQISQEMGISVSTVHYHRERNGLQPNKPKKAEDPCLTCSEYSRKVCKQMGGVCAEKARCGA